MPYDPKIGPGNPFLVDNEKGLVYQIDSQGQRYYYPLNSISPRSLAESQQGLPHDQAGMKADWQRAREQGMGQGGGIFTKRKAWDPQRAEFRGGIDWPMLLTTAGAAAPFAALAIPALAGAGAGGGAAGGASAGSAAATGAGTVLPSTAIGTGLSTLPAGLASGAVSGGVATGLAAPGAALLGSGNMGVLGTIGKAAAKYGKSQFNYKDPSSYMDLAERLGSIGKGRAEGRQQEALSNQAQDRLRIALANFNREAPAVRAGHSVRGDILAGLQPATLSGEGRNVSRTGGLSPSLLSGGTRELGRSMSRQALLSQLGQGGPNDPYTQNVTPLPEPGLLDDILTGAGYAGGLLSQYGQDEPRQTRQTQNYQNTQVPIDLDEYGLDVY